ERERVWIDIGEDNLQPRNTRQRRHHPEGERRHDDLRPFRKVESPEDVVKSHASVGGGDSLSPSGAARQRILELFNLGALNELAAYFGAGDNLFSFWQDSRSIARDSRQHATVREMSAISSRVWKSLTLRSSRLTHSRTAVF